MSLRTPHALVVGKFYPPHAGHHLLIRTAAATAERVTVLVIDHPRESIPGAQRIDWLREVHGGDPRISVHGAQDTYPVDYHSQEIWRLHVEVIQTGVAEVTSVPVSAVYSSEPYGPELARWLNSEHVAVDPQRELVPISATAIRTGPVATWEYLAAPVRRDLAARVVVIGAESTGTTTVAKALRRALRQRGGSFSRTNWVPEYGREYTVDKVAIARARAQLAGLPIPDVTELEWLSPEFTHIGEQQNRLEDEAAATGGPVLICDTDAFATGVWHERYLGESSPAVDALARPHPLYLLTDHQGIPFEADGIRDGEHVRQEMTGWFTDALTRSGRRFEVLEGPVERRVQMGLQAIDTLLQSQWRFTAPDTPPNGADSS